ncbi:hypothetical protein [Thiorhodococcus minor]|uniref:PilZ domain-containing protein n=1 Tax=Thiorhodococcus minor TaxID=57489 RepID=A0A6M0K221_9GAMM|nr:hypothetical protein [Thiorhodococcus minor]NEV63802.1 hypothetical protein [Thiorhodococcus minor]
MTFEVKDEEDFDFSLLSTCMVSYFSDGKAHVFVSTLRSYNTIIGGDSAQLVLRLPEDITVSETRGTFRIPMENVEGFTFQLLDARDRSYSPRCVNIGPGGMKLSFDDESDPGFEESDTLRTRINYRGRSVILMAEIRYHIGHSYGIFFPKVFEKCESEASEIYRWIVNALEEEYSSGQVQTAS